MGGGEVVERDRRRVVRFWEGNIFRKFEYIFSRSNIVL